MQLDEHSRKIAALVAYNEKQIKEINRLITLLNERVNDLNTFTGTLEREGKVVSGISYSLRDSVSHVDFYLNKGMEEVSCKLQKSVSDTLTSLLREKLSFTLNDVRQEWTDFEEQTSKEIKESLKQTTRDAEVATGIIRKTMEKYTVTRIVEKVIVLLVLFLLLMIAPGFYAEYLKMNIGSLMEEQKKHESMLKEWKEKAPLAEFSKCGEYREACVLVDDKSGYYYDEQTPNKKYAILK
ncbi:hypothetical protein [Escherichia coli]|nr:hypothetical protein [Escherichia coli]EDH5808050.1 hypothetical protein [Salmonella enterica subsp. enterica serovar Typhimurium]MBM2972721.1 hypothetical protein [Escherichia coli]MBM2972732.1 hypothetical protein [Escherichia coli]MBW0077941.1 hypothetical protein [Escherichia coli]